MKRGKMQRTARTAKINTESVKMKMYFLCSLECIYRSLINKMYTRIGHNT